MNLGKAPDPRHLWPCFGHRLMESATSCVVQDAVFRMTVSLSTQAGVACCVKEGQAVFLYIAGIKENIQSNLFEQTSKCKAGASWSEGKR